MSKDNNSLAGLATIFEKFNKPIEDKSLLLIAKEIQEGKYRTQVEWIRKLVAEGDTSNAEKCKKSLLAFAASATFKDGRKRHHLNQYSHFIILDFDNLTVEQYAAAMLNLRTCPYTFFAFRSPSGTGLKILLKVTSGPEHHTLAFNQVAHYYENLLGLKVDPSGKDINRLCFMSYDPDAYKNLNIQSFPVEIPNAKQPVSQTPVISDDATSANSDFANLTKFAKSFQNCIERTQSKLSFETGNRNNFNYRLSCNCNRAGIPQEVALQLILVQFNYDKKEIRATVKSAYDNHPEQFASFANFAPPQNTKQDQRDELEAALSNSPYFPDEIFPQLPQLLQKGCNVLTDRRERDVFLTSALTILSGCFTSVSGLYDSKIYYPNLFCFIVAPAASGKGALIYARQLGAVMHNKMYAQSKEVQQEYETQLEQFKIAKSRKKQAANTDDLQPPAKPKFPLLFIPANSSTAAVMNHLDQNDGTGIICETEADTMANTFKQDWGGYSDLLRKAFHHETISSSRKTNNEYIQVERPRLSIGLSGTPGQVTGLIASAEDGLFSRFMFYTFKSKPVWRDVSPVNGLNLTAHYNSLSQQVNDFATAINKTPAEFNLTAQQWQLLNKNGESMLTKVVTFESEDASSTVKRLGLITYRIAMVFSILRNMEQGLVAEPTITCSDNDFNTATALVDVFLAHGMLMFKALPKSSGTRLDPLKRKFFEALPTDKEFSRAEAVAIGKQITISESAVDKYLKNLLGTYLIHGSQYGYYAVKPV